MSRINVPTVLTPIVLCHRDRSSKPKNMTPPLHVSFELSTKLCITGMLLNLNQESDHFCFFFPDFLDSFAHKILVSWQYFPTDSHFDLVQSGSTFYFLDWDQPVNNKTSPTLLSFQAYWNQIQLFLLVDVRPTCNIYISYSPLFNGFFSGS